jgi:hypothetical protein
MIITKQVDFLYFVKRGLLSNRTVSRRKGFQGTTLLSNNADEEVLTKGLKVI